MVNVIHDCRWAWRMIWIMWWRGLLTLTNDSRRGLAPLSANTEAYLYLDTLFNIRIRRSFSLGYL